MPEQLMTSPGRAQRRARAAAKVNTDAGDVLTVDGDAGTVVIEETA